MKDISHVTKELLIKTIKEKVTQKDIMKELNIDATGLQVLLAVNHLKISDVVSNEQRKKHIREKTKLSNIEKYGVDNPAKTEEFRKWTSKRKTKDLSHITKETLLNVLDQLKTRGAVCNHFQIQRNMLEKLLLAFDLDFDVLVPIEEQKKSAVEKRQKTSLQKYGVTNPMKSKEVQNKLITTNQNKYGYDFPFGSEVFLEKAKETWTKNLGVDNPFKSDVVAEKTKQSNVERYGVENILLSKTKREQIEATMIERYGVKTPFLSEEIKETRRQNWLKKYGVDNPFKSDVVIEKINRTKLRNGTMFVSSGEQSVRDFISSIYSGEVIYNTRSVVPGNELDIYIPEHKLAIEFNGTYWHSFEHNQDKEYHYRKSLKCEELNIRLIHIFEGYWNREDKRKIYEQIISNALDLSLNKLRASKCELRPLTPSEARQFFNENHLHGYVPAKYAYGLFHNGELIQAELFGKARFRQNVEWESLRGCSKSGWMIYGGYEKVLKQFKLEQNAKSIVSYVDFNTFRGSLHEKANFRFEGYTGPDHWYYTTEEEFKRYWIIRGSKPKDLQWAKEREEKIIFNYYFAGSKIYIWREK